jgi:xenotropic and polytropic retrovirus receptor 1
MPKSLKPSVTLRRADSLTFLCLEWRIKYLNYKAGKKYVKAVQRAISRAQATPSSISRRGEPQLQRASSYFNAVSPFLARSGGNTSLAKTAEEVDPLRSSPAPIGHGGSGKVGPAKPIPTKRADEREALKIPGTSSRYGSFVKTPPARTPPIASGSRRPFELPAPAMRIPSNPSEPGTHPTSASKPSMARLTAQRSASMAGAIPGMSRGDSSGESALQRPVQAQRSGSGFTPSVHAFRRLFSTASPLSRGDQAKLDIGMQNFDVVREKERDFFHFLDSELIKIEAFYKLKEEQAGQRLTLLREQLHEMRNQRTQELQNARRRKEQEDPNGGTSSDDHHKGRLKWIEPVKSKIFKPGPNSKALQKMTRTPVFGAKNGDAKKDYIRKPQDHDVPYRTAKRKLKLALQEFYRGLELLKSYAILNRTAFRKLNKKYDKAINARPPYRYLNEKVNKSWFVNSDVLDGHIHAVEDLYARYFEKGNHKIAAGKLRSLGRKAGDESASTFRNGLFIGTGLVFGLQGLVLGARLLWNADPILREQTSYLLQIYGGYFFMLYLFILFCVDCHIWTRNKINYPFIFEFDPRHHLDWRQLAEFPSFFVFLLGIFVWLNFSRYGSPSMYLYYPVALVFLTVLIIFFPAPVLGHRSRQWFIYSHVIHLGPHVWKSHDADEIAVAAAPCWSLPCRV